MNNMWSDMFALGVPVLEKVLRVVIIYLVLIVGLRLAGKRELAQLNPFDLVVLLTISNTVQNAIIGNDNTVTGGIIGVAALLLINYLVVRFVYRNDRIEKLVEGEEDVLIRDGEVNQKALERETISLTELEIAAHKQGFNSLADIDRAILEPGGGFSFSARQPSPEEGRHNELLSRLDALTREVATLRAELEGRAPGTES